MKKISKKIPKITYLSRKFGSKASPLLGCVVAFGYSDFFSSFDRRALFFCFWTSLSDELSESPDDDDELEEDELKNYGWNLKLETVVFQRYLEF